VIFSSNALCFDKVLSHCPNLVHWAQHIHNPMHLGLSYLILFLQVHYPRWSTSWDEWISLCSLRLTNVTKDTNAGPDRGSCQWVSFDHEIEPCKALVNADQIQEPKTNELQDGSEVEDYLPNRSSGDKDKSRTDEDKASSEKNIVKMDYMHEAVDIATSARGFKNSESTGLQGLTSDSPQSIATDDSSRHKRLLHPSFRIAESLAWPLNKKKIRIIGPANVDIKKESTGALEWICSVDIMWTDLITSPEGMKAWLGRSVRIRDHHDTGSLEWCLNAYDEQQGFQAQLDTKTSLGIVQSKINQGSNTNSRWLMLPSPNVDVGFRRGEEIPARPRRRDVCTIQSDRPVRIGKGISSRFGAAPYERGLKRKARVSNCETSSSKKLEQESLHSSNMNGSFAHGKQQSSLNTVPLTDFSV
jgi:hypothetical protein